MKPRGPIAVAVLCSVPVLLWIMAAPLGPRFSNPSIALTSLGSLFGLVGASAFALNLVLGARLKAIDSWFGGLDKMYRFHRGNGRIAFVLLVVHALLIVSGRGAISLSSALSLFSPGGGVAAFLGVVALAGMTIAIVLTLFVRLAHEMFVYVQRSFGPVFVIAGAHMFLTPGTKALSRALTIYMGVLTVSGLAAWGYRSLLGNVLVRRHDYRVTGVARLDETVVEITMTPEGRPLDFVPGQFVFVTFYSSAFAAHFHPISLDNLGQVAVITFRPGDVGNQFHPFSITSAPRDSDLKVVVKAVGDFTSALQELDRGAVAKVEGPYGRFSHLNASGTRQVWIAGGIGVTPFLSMARSLDGSRVDVDFFYGMKTARRATSSMSC